MGKIIAIIGGKGGSSKTTMTHALCHGLGLLGIKSVAIITDTRRQPVDERGRTYMVFDARDATGKKLESAVKRVAALDDSWVGVIDGGGNREAVDAVLYRYADLSIVPFQASQDDFDMARQAAEAMPAAFLWPTAWPSRRGPQLRADAARTRELGAFAIRTLSPVLETSNASLLTLRSLVDAESGGIIRYPTAIHNLCRQVARQVMDLLNIRCPHST